MRVEVFGEDTISSQARAYAEYRVFAALTQALNADACSGVRVALSSVHAGRGHNRIACTVTIASGESDILRVRATGQHACAAIDRAVERMVALAAQRPRDIRDDSRASAACGCDTVKTACATASRARGGRTLPTRHCLSRSASPRGG